MVPWFLLVEAGEIGILIGFMIIVLIFLSQIKQLTKKLSLFNYSLGAKKTGEVFHSLERKEFHNSPVIDEKSL